MTMTTGFQSVWMRVQKTGSIKWVKYYAPEHVGICVRFTPRKGYGGKGRKLGVWHLIQGGRVERISPPHAAWILKQDANNMVQDNATPPPFWGVLLDLDGTELAKWRGPATLQELTVQGCSILLNASKRVSGVILGGHDEPVGHLTIRYGCGCDNPDCLVPAGIDFNWMSDTPC